IQRSFESAALPRLRLCCLAFVIWFGVLMIAAAVMAIVASWPGTYANRFRQPWSYALCYGLSSGTLGCLGLAWQPRRRAGASVPWPERLNDLPGNFTYFCFDSDGTAKNLPFAWEKVTDVVCARFRNAEVSANVVVGKRINSH